MLLGTVFAEHVGKAHQALASSVSYDHLWILESTLQVWPELLEMRLNVEGDTLHGDTKSHDGALAHIWVVRSAVLLEESEQRREDMGRREVCSECIETLECNFRGRITFIIVIVVFGLCSDR